MLLTGEANVKREEEFERERDEEIYVYSMKIPRFHPSFGQISCWRRLAIYFRGSPCRFPLLALAEKPRGFGVGSESGRGAQRELQEEVERNSKGDRSHGR